MERGGGGTRNVVAGWARGLAATRLPALGGARRAVEPQRHAVRAHVRGGRDEVPRERHPWNRLAVQPPGAARLSADRRRSEALLLAAGRPDDSRDGAHVGLRPDRKSTRLNSSHSQISYAVF